MPPGPAPMLARLLLATAFLVAAPAAAQPAPATSGRLVRVPGAEIHVREHGSGEPLLLLHGFLDCGSAWDPFVARLAERHRVIVMDLRGHGRSTNPSRTFTMRRSADDVLAVLDTLGLRRVRAMGISAGGMTLLHVATRQPERLQSLVLIGATTRFVDQTREFIRDGATREAIPAPVLDMFRQCTSRGEGQLDELLAQFTALGEMRDDPNFTAADLARITAPTLVVHGDRDEFFPVEIAVEMYRGIPTAELWVIPRGDHVPIYDPLVPFADVALRFLAQAGLAIRDVTVVDVETGRLLPSQTVVVRGNRITAMGASASVRVPPGATVVDGTGKYLVPGLWDMHAHLPEPPWLRTLGPQLLVAHGVTGVREMFSDCTVCGADSTGTTSLLAMQRLRDDIRAGRLVGPRLLLSSGAIESPPGSEGWEQVVRTPAEAAAAVDGAVARGVDQIAVFAGTTREAFTAIAERARHHRVPLAPLLPVTIRPEESAALGVRSRESVGEWVLACAADADRHRAAMAAAIAEDAADSTAKGGQARWLRYRRTRQDTLYATFDARRCAALAGRVGAAGGWQVPRLVQGWRRSRLARPDAAATAQRDLVWASARAWWLPLIDSTTANAATMAQLATRVERERAIVGLLHRAGVPMLAGTEAGDLDVLPGVSLHDELALLVQAGLSPLAALRAATLEPARYLSATDSMGTVAVGKVADLVLLDANPLADIANTRRIRAVVVNGRLQDRAALDGLLTEARAAATSAPPAPPAPAHADTAALRADAQAIVTAFAAEIARARGASLGDAPSVQVRNTPQLIFFGATANQVVVPLWETQPPAMRTVFGTFAGGGDAEAERLFRAFFNRFLVAHEAAHWFQARAGRRAPTLYENEDMANRLAVAFWRTQPGGEPFLAELERLATQAAANLSDPTPPGEDAVAYFGANYQTLGRDPLKYGYYQFRFMRDALRERGQLDFARMTSDAGR